MHQNMTTSKKTGQHPLSPSQNALKTIDAKFQTKKYQNILKCEQNQDAECKRQKLNMHNAAKCDAQTAEHHPNS